MPARRSVIEKGLIHGANRIQILTSSIISFHSSIPLLPMSDAHILVIPFPAQGHLIPLLDLTHRLSTAIPNLTLTILTTPSNLPLISPLLSPSIHSLPLPLPPHPSLPPHADHVRRLPSPSSVSSLIHSLSSLSPQILSWARSQPSPPTAVLSDFFLGWTHRLAADLAVPRFAFYSSGALLVSVLDRLFRHGAAGEPSFRYEHLPSIFRRYDAARGDPEWEFVGESMIANSLGYAAVLNTFDALESKYLDRVRGIYGHDRVWAVGPISSSVPGSVRGGRSSVPVEEVISWLDTCPSRSVVYICFGSQFRLGDAQARALASALELSGARFIWCAGPSSVPQGFEERAEGRGVVIRGWAPQAAVLGHGSVGSFVTHCGWNSVVEGVVNGVLLLTWPMEADQFVNARLLVEEMEMAVPACGGGPDVVPEPEALARVVAGSVDERVMREVKGRVAEMGRMAAEAVGEGGSSWVDMDKLAKELNKVG